MSTRIDIECVGYGDTLTADVFTSKSNGRKYLVLIAYSSDNEQETEVMIDVNEAIKLHGLLWAYIGAELRLKYGLG